MAHAAPVRIGVLAFQPQHIASKQWLPLAEYLNEQMPEQHFELTTLNFRDLDREVNRGSFDFIITNPGHYVILRDKKLVDQASASFAKRAGEHYLATFAGVMFTLADNQRIHSMRDLESASIAAVFDESLGGYEMQAYEMLQAGIDYRHLNMIWTGMPHDRAVDAVLAHRAEAGFVRTGVLERLFRDGRLRPEQIRVIDKHLDDELPLLHSTDEYPEWAFVASVHADPRLLKQVTKTLLGVEPGSGLSLAMKGVFVPPYNYDSVRNILISLGMPPYNTVKERVVSNIWSDYKVAIISSAISLLLVFVLSLFLVSANRKLGLLNSKLKEMSEIDGLTGIYNRRYFDHYLNTQVNISIRHGVPISLILLDIDHFKRINDTYGHQAGDAILKEVAARVAAAARTSDIVARYGGEEFAVVCVGNDSQAGRLTAERLRGAVAAMPFVYESESIPVTVSAGVATWGDAEHHEFAMLVRSADEALYEAKQSGRDRVVVASS